MLPEEVQRRVAKFTPEGGTQATSGDKLFGRRHGIARDQNCTCGICLAPNRSATQCTLLRGPSKVLRRETSELCKAVCVSRSPLRMLLKFVRYILQYCQQRHTGQHRSIVRVTLQVDGDPLDRRRRADRSYLLNAYYDQLHHELEIDFQRRLILDDHDTDISIIGYQPGDEISENGVPARVRERVERALLDANGKSASLVIVAPDMDHGEFTIGSIRFRDEGQAYRAEPIFFYIW